MKRREKGLTLIELMVTLAVAIVLLAIGIPAFQGIETNSRAVALANGLVTALSLARTEAMSRSMPVTVCARSGPTVETCGDAAADWVNGWLVFEDPAMLGAVGTIDDAERPLIRAFDRPKGQPAVDAVDLNDDEVAFIRFGSNGMQNRGIGVTASEVVMTLDQQGDSGKRYRRCVTVNFVGSIRAERKATCP